MSKKLSEHFFEHEFASPDTGETKMDPAFIEALEKLRAKLAFEFVISHGGGYRTPAYNELKGGAPDSMHLQGKAADISHKCMTGSMKYTFVRESMAMGFSVGAYDCHFHLDLRSSPSVFWISLSR